MKNMHILATVLCKCWASPSFSSRVPPWAVGRFNWSIRHDSIPLWTCVTLLFLKTFLKCLFIPDMAPTNQKNNFIQIQLGNLTGFIAVIHWNMGGWSHTGAWVDQSSCTNHSASPLSGTTLAMLHHYQWSPPSIDFLALKCSSIPSRLCATGGNMDSWGKQYGLPFP